MESEEAQYEYGLDYPLKEFIKKPVGYHTRKLIEAMSKMRLLSIVHFNN